MSRSYEPSEPADRGLIDLLVGREGRPTAVALCDGRRLTVFNIAWGYDEGDAYAHVTTNISPAIHGGAVDFFLTNQVAAIQDEAGEVIYGEL